MKIDGYSLMALRIVLRKYNWEQKEKITLYSMKKYEAELPEEKKQVL